MKFKQLFQNPTPRSKAENRKIISTYENDKNNQKETNIKNIQKWTKSHPHKTYNENGVF